MFGPRLHLTPLVSLIVSGILLSACADEASRPVAIISGPTQGQLGSVVQLDGSQSDDPEGERLSFQWRIARLPSDSAATLNDTTISNPSFTVDRPGEYVIELVVHAGSRASAPQSHVVTAAECGSRAPEVIAITTDPATPSVGQAIRLAGQVADADNEAGCDLGQQLTFNWQLTGLPTGSRATLNDPALASPVFTADLSGTYTVALTVTDTAGLTSAPGTHEFTVSVCGEAAPALIAVSADPTDPALGETVELSATAEDADNGESCGRNQALSFAWSLVEAPASSTAAIERADLADAWFVPDVAGSYVLAVVASDDTGRASAADTLTVTAADSDVEVTVTATPELGLLPLTVDFACSATGDAPIQYAWSFGNGSVSNLQNPSFTYIRPGNFTATCLAVDVDGDASSAGIDIAVGGDTAPQVEVTADPRVGVAPLEVTFSALATGGEGELAYFWDFADGKTSADSAPTNIFANPGNYAVVLSVTDSDGDVGTAIIDIAVGADSEPAVIAVAEPVSGIAPLAVQLRALTAGGDGELTFAWSFGDGDSSALRNPPHVYDTDRDESFTAEVTVTDADGDRATGEVVIAVAADLEVTADAQATVTSGRAPLLVGFTCDADGGNPPLEYSWTFGDGTTSSEQNPAHIYREADSYTATCAVTDADGDVDTDTVDVTVVLNRVPTVSLSADVTSGVEPLEVTFQATVSGGDGAIVHGWDFGNGTTDPDGDLVETETYAAGVYQIGVVVEDVDGDRDRATIQISVDPQGPPMEVVATANPARGIGSSSDPLEVDFGAQVSGGNPPYTYAWEFDGSGGSTLANPTVAFTPGVYDVSLLVTDVDGDAEGATVRVTVDDDLVPDVGTLVASREDPLELAPLLVAFQCPVTGGNPPLRYAWSFGDGQSSTSQHPSHTYAAAGTYTASCTATDVDGDSDTGAVAVTAVRDTTPVPSILGGPLSGLEGLTVDLSSSVVGGNGAITVLWTFGDLAIANSTAANPAAVTYATPGSYSVVLRATDADGDVGEATALVVVGADHTPTVAITAVPLSGIEPLTVSFTATVAGGNGESTLAWDLDEIDQGGDLDLLDDSISPNPTFTYDAGTFTVTVRATDEDGSFDEDSVEISVVADDDDITVVADHAVIDNELQLAPLTVELSCQGTGGNGPLAYAWAFGDGGSSTLQEPTHVYAAAGTYTAVCTATDTDGAAESATTIVVVNPDTAPVLTLAATPTNGTLGPAGGLPVAFSSAVEGGNGELTYEWSFGGPGTLTSGGQAVDWTAHFTYTTAGPRVATLTVTDEDNDSDTATVNIVVRTYNAPTVVASAVPSTGIAPLSVGFFANTTGGEGPLTFQWDFQDDAAPVGLDADVDATAQNPSFVYTAAGDYTALVRVTDTLGVFAEAQVAVTVAPDDAPENVTLIADPDRTRAPVTAELTCTFDPGNGATTLQWVFGDGQTATVNGATSQAKAVHTYGVPGSYEAQCIATDADGDTNFATAVVPVAPNSVPEVTLVANRTSGVACEVDDETCDPFEVAFTASAVGGDEEPSDITWTWDFGLGTGDGDEDSANETATFQAGTFVVTVRGCDIDVVDCDTASVTINVADDLQPTVAPAVSPASGVSPLTAQLSAGAESGNPPLSISWVLGDGTTGTGPNVTHVYTAPDGDSFTAVVTVEDADGDEAVGEVDITVLAPNRAPTAIARRVGSAGPPPENGDFCEDLGINEDHGNLVPLTAQFSSDPDSNPLTYAWSFNSVPPDAPVPQIAHNSTLRDVHFIATATGEYELLLRVSDGNLSDSTVIAVQVCSSVSAPVCQGTAEAGFSCAATCTDGFRNRDETDTDCGGAFCAGCDWGESCLVDTDCGVGLTTPDLVCGNNDLGLIDGETFLLEPICRIPGVWVADAFQSPNVFQDGRTWQTAFVELQDTIDVASAAAERAEEEELEPVEQEIWVANGNYFPPSDDGFLIESDGLEVYGDFTGLQREPEHVEDGGAEGRQERSREERGSGPEGELLTSASILDGGDCTLFCDCDCFSTTHVMQIFANEVVLDGFTVENGTAFPDEGGGFESAFGGGIVMVESTDSRLSNLTIADNGGFAGGGLAAILVDGLHIENATFLRNGAGLGGGAFIGESIGVTIVDSRFGAAGVDDEEFPGNGNVAAPFFSGGEIPLGEGGGGAGLLSVGVDGLEVIDTVFERNLSFANGGGALIGTTFFEVASANASFTGCAFLDNYAGETGGGLAVLPDEAFVGDGEEGVGEVEIAASLFRGNFAELEGGAVAAELLRNLEILGTTFLQNEAESGGGLWVSTDSCNDACFEGVRYDVLITHSAFYENQAVDGGAAYFRQISPTVRQSRFFDNEVATFDGDGGFSAFGGAIAHLGTLPEFFENDELVRVEARYENNVFGFNRALGEDFGQGGGGRGGSLYIAAAAFDGAALIHNNTFYGDNAEAGGDSIHSDSDPDAVVVANSLLVGCLTPVDDACHDGVIDSVATEAGEGDFCLPDFVQEPGSPPSFALCQTDTECGVGELCLDGQCSFCDDDALCGEGAICVVNRGVCADFNLVDDPEPDCIDEGDDAFCLTSDFFGAERPKDFEGGGLQICDLGAFEKQPPSIP